MITIQQYETKNWQVWSGSEAGKFLRLIGIGSTREEALWEAVKQTSEDLHSLLQHIRKGEEKA